MLLSLIYFLPCIVSLLWFVSFLLKNKNDRQKLFCCAEGTSLIFYAILGIYFFPDVDYYTMVRMEAISIPFGLIFPAFITAYMYMQCYDKKPNDKVIFLLLIPAIVIGVAINLLCNIIGFDKAAEISQIFASNRGLTGAYDTHLNQLYCFFTYDLFIVLSLCYILLLLWLSIVTLIRHGYKFGDVFRFFFCKKETTSSRTIATLYIAETIVFAALALLGSVYLRSNVTLGIFLMIALATLKHLIAHIEFYSDDRKMVTLYSLSHLTLFGSEEKDEETEGESAPAPVAPAQTVVQKKTDKRLEQFKELMEVKKIWKDEELTAQTVCDIMGIGKTTLSAIISNNYDASFRDLVNSYRIEEAKRYMKANPKATQETIALQCGFKNAQYFNTQFKKIVGETPSMWLAKV